MDAHLCCLIPKFQFWLNFCMVFILVIGLQYSSQLVDFASADYILTGFSVLQV